GGVAGGDRGEGAAAAADAAGAEDEVASEEGRADAAFVESFVVAPELLAGIGIDGVDAVGLAVEEDLGAAGFVLAGAGGGVGDDGVAARSLPAHGAALRVERSDETLTVAGTVLDEILPILLAAEDDFVADDDGRSAAGMLADVGAEIVLPEDGAVVIE